MAFTFRTGPSRHINAAYVRRMVKRKYRLKTELLRGAGMLHQPTQTCGEYKGVCSARNQGREVSNVGQTGGNLNHCAFEIPKQKIHRPKSTITRLHTTEQHSEADRDRDLSIPGEQNIVNKITSSRDSHRVADEVDEQQNHDT